MIGDGAIGTQPVGTLNQKNFNLAIEALTKKITITTSTTSEKGIVGAPKVRIGGEDYYPRSGSISIKKRINERSTASFNIHAPDDHFQEYEAVFITDEDSFLVFSGFLQKPKEEKLNDEGDLMHKLRATGNLYLTDKRLIADSFENTSAGDIIRSIISNTLSDEGIQEGIIRDGPTVKQIVFNYETATEAINRLADRSRFWWDIDLNKDLHFRPRNEVKAPFDITADDVRYGTSVRKNENPEYRNFQYITDASNKTDSITTLLETNGEKQSWALSFPVAEEPTVKINNSEVGVRVKGSNSNEPFLWRKGDEAIAHDAVETPLSSSDTLEVTYKGYFDVVGTNQDSVAQSDRARITGTSGIVENKISDNTIDTLDAANQKAENLNDKYAREGTIYQFRTGRKGLKPGQLVTLDQPDHDINQEEFLITEVSLVDLADRITEYDVKAVKGPVQGSWTEFWKNVSKQTETLSFQQNQNVIVTQVFNFSKTWQASDQPNPFHHVRPSTSLQPGTSLLPSFEPETRIEYLAWGDGTSSGNGQLGNELGRKRVTQVTNEETLTNGESIDSTVILSTSEANTQIEELGWFGGGQASKGKNTGVMLDRVSFSQNKTPSDRFQIQRTDTLDFDPV